jgi:D-lactate dehydrogenase (cytochrome)
MADEWGKTMNIIRPTRIETQAVCPSVTDPSAIRQSFADYMTDESQLQSCFGTTLYFPTTTEETVAAMIETAAHRQKLVISGGRTGVVGGAAVTQACNIISLERLRRRPLVSFDEQGNHWCVTAGAGTTVKELNSALDEGHYDFVGRRPEKTLCYPVDPTEETAQLGGTLATNASGARSLFYGPTRQWVQWVRMVLADGCVLDLRRGEIKAEGLRFQIADGAGRLLPLSLPRVARLQAKATVGYLSVENMDAVDLVVGSEGTLGVITEMELRLIERPAHTLAISQHFDSEDRALDFILALRAQRDVSPLSIEYFDRNSIVLLREKRRREGAASEVPALPIDISAIVFVEWAMDAEEGLSPVLVVLEKLLADTGASLDRSWAVTSAGDREQLKQLRHLLPEAVNTIIAQRKRDQPEIHKVGSDIAVPIEHLREMMRIYRHSLEACGLQHLIFGHIGDGHLHVNVLPKTAGDMASALELYREFARQAVRLGGSVSAEHGIGKMKRDLLFIQYSADVVAQMRQIKQAFDPEERLNPGVLFKAT